MKLRIHAILITSSLMLFTTGSVHAGDKGGRDVLEKKKVLIELYTSQGCDSCPSAADLMGRLGALGYGPDRIVPVAFHVDYFNEPWKDPFSEPDFSRRQLSYNAVRKRDDLYFTPMMMVDGRYPMLGSDRNEALASIKKALGERPAASLHLDLKTEGGSRVLSVEAAAKLPEAVDREVLVGVAVAEDPVSTDVPSGENAGKTLVEHYAVRFFAYKLVKLARDDVKTLTFPLTAGQDWAVENCRVGVFVQDRQNGKVYQADSLPWTTQSGSGEKARSPVKAGRRNTLRGAGSRAKE